MRNSSWIENISLIQKKNLSRLWKSLKIILRFFRATYEREQIKKLTIWLKVISEYSWMVQKLTYYLWAGRFRPFTVIIRILTSSF